MLVDIHVTGRISTQKPPHSFVETDLNLVNEIKFSLILPW